MGRAAAVIIAVSLLGIAGVGAVRLLSDDGVKDGPNLRSAESVAADPEAPELVIRTADRGDVRLSEQRGRVVLADFWATWCPPCRESAPRIQALYEKYRDQGLVVLGPSFDDTDEPIAPFARQAGLTYPVGRIVDEAAADAFGVAALPTVVLIDRKGAVRWRGEGFGDYIERELAWRIPALLKE